MSLTAGRALIMPTFAISSAHLARQSAFWLFLKQGGKPVACVAATLQQLGRESLADFLVRTYRNQFPHPNGETILEVAEPLYDYSGSLVYVGELARRDGFKGDRKVLAALMRVMQLVAIDRWDFDAIYAFIPARHYKARLDRVYSFSTVIEAAQLWNEPVPEKRSSDEYLVSSTRAQLANSLRAEARGFWGSLQVESCQEVAQV